jgi:hypothetical protein
MFASALVGFGGSVYMLRSQSRDKLVVKKLSDSLDMHRKSIGGALNQRPDDEATIQRVEKTISELNLSKEQTTRLQSAQEKYRQQSREAIAKLAEKLMEPEAASEK